MKNKNKFKGYLIKKGILFQELPDNGLLVNIDLLNKEDIHFMLNHSAKK